MTQNLLTDWNSPAYIESQDRLENDVVYGRCSRYAPFLHATKMVHLSGRIEVASSQAVDSALRNLLSTATSSPLFSSCASIIVSLNITGGDVLSAISIGRTLMELEIPTIILPGNLCQSACVYIFAGGTANGESSSGLFPGSNLRIHLPRGTRTDELDQAFSLGLQFAPENTVSEIRQKTQSILNQTFSYFNNVVRKPSYFDLILRSPVSSNDFWSISSFSELKRLSITSLVGEISDKPAVSPLDELYVSRVCAVEMLGLNLGRSVLPATLGEYGGSMIVALGEPPVFCFVASASGINDNDTHVCLFTANSLISLVRRNENTPLQSWVQITGGLWWPSNTFSDDTMMRESMRSAGASSRDFAQFFRGLMFGDVNDVTLNGTFCLSTNSLSSREYRAFGDASVFDTACANGLGYCVKR